MQTTQIGRRTLALADAFFPDAPFEIVARLPAGTTIDILNGLDDEGLPAISRPDEYSGYVVAYTFATVPRYTFLFSQRSLTAGRVYRFAGPVTYFSPNLHAVETSIRRVSVR